MNKLVCPSWLSVFLENGLRKKIHNPGKIVKEYIKPGSTVVDIGCGPGYFSIPMAEMTGKDGKVISVDIQEKMLHRIKNYAKRHNVDARIRLTKCSEQDICVNEKADFILTFWMVHEVQDVKTFMDQIFKVMKPGSFYLLCEPKIHVSKKRYLEIISIASSAGLKEYKEEKIWGSRSMVFKI
jgi:2-polyprenyl-3-methyl-5-hydroxy-6-metoxy-1,4-benzoquinol methylase